MTKIRLMTLASIMMLSSCSSYVPGTVVLNESLNLLTVEYTSSNGQATSRIGIGARAQAALPQNLRLFDLGVIKFNQDNKTYVIKIRDGADYLPQCKYSCKIKWRGDGKAVLIGY